MLAYPRLDRVVAVGSKSGTTRTSSTLTSSYDVTENTKILDTEGYSVFVLDILYTTGSGETNNSIEVRVEGSPDRVNFYRLSNESVSSGTSSLFQREFTFVGASAATAYDLSYRIDISYKHMRLSVKESGVSANAGTAYVEATLAGW